MPVSVILFLQPSGRHLREDVAMTKWGNGYMDPIQNHNYWPLSEIKWEAARRGLHNCFEADFWRGADLLSNISESERPFDKWTFYISSDHSGDRALVFCFSNEVDAIYAKMLL
jgi:hypothetical protein